MFYILYYWLQSLLMIHSFFGYLSCLWDDWGPWGNHKPLMVFSLPRCTSFVFKVGGEVTKLTLVLHHDKSHDTVLMHLTQLFNGKIYKHQVNLVPLS